ncbi:MAG TPA: hypothetical protein VK797_24020 [Tepidisphaeraceae bacterium]|nr:hypothetical protein [Tepidisphaeraceae bacterium]
MRPGRALAFVAMVLFAAGVARAQSQSEDSRQPVPNSSKQSPVLKELKEQYKAEYANREADGQLQLARTFRKEAAISGEDPVRQFVLLREARELAVNAGDLDEAFGIIDDMAKLFTVDASDMKVTAMAASLDRARVPPGQLVDQYLKIADAALATYDVRMASQAMVLTKRIVYGSHDAAAIARVHATDLRVHEASRQLEPVARAANYLKDHPDDARANLTVGRFLCFVRGMWTEGLPLLAKGSDKTLADLANKDISHPADAPGQMQLADAWWSLPDSKDTPQKQSRQRAAYWYEQALPQLNDPQKTLAQQRITEAKTAN